MHWSIYDSFVTPKQTNILIFVVVVVDDLWTDAMNYNSADDII